MNRPNSLKSENPHGTLKLSEKRYIKEYNHTIQDVTFNLPPIPSTQYSCGLNPLKTENDPTSLKGGRGTIALSPSEHLMIVE